MNTEPKIRAHIRFQKVIASELTYELLLISVFGEK